MDKIICIRSGKAGSAFLLSRTYPDFPEFFQTQKAMNLNLSRFESPLGAVLLVW
jgi:hypothetical protein